LAEAPVCDSQTWEPPPPGNLRQDGSAAVHEHGPAYRLSEIGSSLLAVMMGELYVELWRSPIGGKITTEYYGLTGHDEEKKMRDRVVHVICAYY